MRIALVHDWLTGMRGGEKVLSLLCRLFPQADLLTLVRVPGACDATIERMPIRTSGLNDLPGVGRYYRLLLPLMPLAVERLPAEGYDLVVSCSHCVAKGVIRAPEALHACYCFTPMRYVWRQLDAYAPSGPQRAALKALRGYLRAWDLRSAGHVDLFLANSENIARQIGQVYRRPAQVVYSPIDTTFFTPAAVPREDFYLVVGALAPYKRVDHAVAAFRRLGRRLVVIGAGQQFDALRRAAPPNVEFLGRQSDAVVRDHYRRCRAFLMPGEEDFGLTPLEAMACGAPAIALRAGGATETVLEGPTPDGHGPTGVLYEPQAPDALADAVLRFERTERRFLPARLTAWARQFSPERFLAGVRDALAPPLADRGLPLPWIRPESSPAR